MSTSDDEARKEYAEAGVDLPEVTEPKEPEADKPKEPEAPAAPTAEAPAEPEAAAPSQPPTEPRRRTIYDDYKDKKSELKTEKELRGQAERERDELQTKLAAVTNAPTAERKEAAEDDVTAYARKIEADPEAIKALIDLARKGMKPELPENVVKDLADFQQWKADNSKILEEAQFNKEFDAALPAIKEVLPSATEDEMKTVKAELDKLSHTKEFYDKPLDYIAFRNRSSLSALISPHKRGLEKKGRVESTAVEFDFDPSADYSKLSPADKEKWEAEYKKATSSEGLLQDAHGRKTIL